MTDVLIGQAYFLRFDAKMQAAQQPYAPLGALYAAAVVRDHGFSVALFDAMLAESEQEWDAALERHTPSVAVIFEDSFNYLSKMCLSRMRQAALAMVSAAESRGVRVLVAGSDASDHPDRYLARGADAVAVGEAELTLVAALQALADGRPLTEVPGLRLPSSAGIVSTSSRPFIRDLDELPRPAWDLVDVDRYRDVWQRRHGYFSMNIATTRGCPFHCNWCAKPIYGQRYTVRRPDAVVEEIAWLQAHYHPDHLWIADDIFGLKPGWIEQFAGLMRERKLAVPFKCLLRADGVTPAVVRALAAAGCRTVWIGAESGSQKVLDAMEKGTTVEQIESATSLLKTARIEVGFFLQFGYPGETLDDIAMTRAMVARCEPDDIGISVSYPLPGTPFFERVKSELGTKQNWIDSDDLALMHHAPYAPEFYRALHALVHAEFRVRRELARWRGAVTGASAGAVPPGRRVASVMAQAVKIPALRWQLYRLSRRPAPEAPPALVPVLRRRAAALPSEPRA